MGQSDHEFRDDHLPFGYLITFRTYGTWLHGTASSVDRFHNIYGELTLPANERRRQYSQSLLRQRPVKLNRDTRSTVELAIQETCEFRKWSLWAINVRTNHVHAVVSANAAPKHVLSAFKANATRVMREAGQWRSERSPWAHGGSRRYLWTEQELSNAVAYVMYDQGEPLT
jgi:REP element-mobilizing transposase RayT